MCFTWASRLEIFITGAFVEVLFYLRRAFFRGWLNVHIARISLGLW